MAALILLFYTASVAKKPGWGQAESGRLFLLNQNIRIAASTKHRGSMLHRSDPSMEPSRIHTTAKLQSTDGNLAHFSPALCKGQRHQSGGISGGTNSPSQRQNQAFMRVPGHHVKPSFATN